MKLNSSSFTTVLLSHAHCIYPVSLFIVDQFPCHLQRSFTLFKYVWTSHPPSIYPCSLFSLIGSVLLASLSLVKTLTPILGSFIFTQATWYLLFPSWPFSLMYALPWTIFTFSLKSSNIPHPARLINCTCCSSPWLVWTSLRNRFHFLHFHTKFQTFFTLLDWSIVLAVSLLGQPVRPALNSHG